MEAGNLPIGEVTTTNLTMLEGGVQYNVIPDKLKVGFDMRITPTTDLVELEEKMNTWCRDACGNDYEIKFIQKFTDPNITCVEAGDKWWDAFSSVVEGECNAKLIKTIFPGEEKKIKN